MFKNLDFQNDRQRSIFWVICSISWISFIVANALGLITLLVRRYIDSDDKVSNNIIWGFLTYYVKTDYYYAWYYPIEWENYYLLIIFLIILLLSLISFIIFLEKTSFKKDENIFDALMGTYSRFHFIPLLCGTSLFLSGILKGNIFRGWNSIKPGEYVFGYLSKYSADLILSLLGAKSLIIIKKNLKLEQPFYIVLIIKDGFYSILLALFTYSFFYASAYIAFLNKFKNCIIKGTFQICFDYNSGASDTLKICGAIFALLVGILNLGIAGYLKDLTISAMNSVIYLGFLFFFYSILGKRKDVMKPPFLEGIFDIIVFVCSIVEMIYLFYIKFKKSNPTSSISTPLTLDE